MALFNLVNLEARTAASCAELRNISLTTSARARFRNVHPLAITLTAVDPNKDIHSNIAGTGRIALSRKAYQSSSNSLGGYACGASDGGGECGNDSLLVSYCLSHRVCNCDSSLGSDVDGEESTVGDILAGSELVGARFTTAELVIVSGTLDIALVEVDSAGICGIDLISAVARPSNISTMFRSIYRHWTYVS